MKTAVGFIFSIFVFFIIIAWLGYSSLQYKGQQAETSSIYYIITFGFKRFYTLIHDYRDDIVATGTLFIAAFTVVLAISTIYLYSATHDLVEGAERTSKQQLRAYITVEGGSITHAIVDNAEGFHVIVQLKNYGLTPAYSFTSWIMPPQILEPSALPFTPPRPLGERSGASIIGPGSSAWINWYARFGPNDLNEIRRGEKAIFIWGGADYTDNFGTRRYFLFRQRIGGQESNPPQGWALSPHPLGYEAD